MPGQILQSPQQSLKIALHQGQVPVRRNLQNCQRHEALELFPGISNRLHISGGRQCIQRPDTFESQCEDLIKQRHRTGKNTRQRRAVFAQQIINLLLRPRQLCTFEKAIPHHVSQQLIFQLRCVAEAGESQSQMGVFVEFLAKITSGFAQMQQGKPAQAPAMGALTLMFVGKHL